MMSAKNRRVRVGPCPHCNCLTKIDPKRKGEPGITICRHCYVVFSSNAVPTFLEDRKATKGGAA